MAVVHLAMALCSDTHSAYQVGQWPLRLLRTMRAHLARVLIARCDEHRARQMEAGLQEMKHQASRRLHLHPLVPPHHSIRSPRAQIGLSVSSRTPRCTRHAHLRAMVVHVITLRARPQYYYSPQISLLSAAGPVHRRGQPACGQVVLGKLGSPSEVCTGMVLVTLALPRQLVVRKEWSARHRKVWG